MGASFQIGRSALAAYQAAISVTGQNIANIANPDYTRQTGRLTGMPGNGTPGLMAGSGVALDGLQRHMDTALENRLRVSTSEREAAAKQYRYLSQIESLYNELSDQDLSTGLANFFAAFGELQADPEDSGQRNIVIAEAQSLINTMSRQRSGLLEQVTQMNDAAEAAVSEISMLAEEVAGLNESIAVQEADGRTLAGALRDRRDALLRQMSEKMDITVRYQDNGTANVYVGSEPLVEFNRSRGLEIERSSENGYEVFKVQFADNQGTLIVNGGELAGIVNTRDQHIARQLEQLDTLAAGVIYEVNRVHASGRGLAGRTSEIGTYDVLDANAALNSTAAGLNFPVSNGTFIVNVRDTVTGQVITRQIEVDLDGLGADTTLNSLAADLNNVPGLSAGVTADNRLQLSAEDGSEYWIGEDTSGAPAALGIGTFFSGTNATTMDIHGAVRNNPRLIAASASGATGDGNQAGKISQLGQAASSYLNGEGLQDFQARMVNELAVAASGARTDYEATDAVYASLLSQRESISGVSLDEEALNLTMYERSFQGASRFLSVIDALSAEVLNLVR